MPYKDPEKNRAAARESMQRARNLIRANRQVREFLGDKLDSPIRNDTVEHSTSALARLMVEQGLTPQKIVSKVSERMESTQLKAICGEKQIVTDNDAQLKATEIAMDLAARAGLLPSDRSINGSGNINLQIISFNAEKQEQAELVLDMQSDNA